jgi:putative phosphoesterase
MKLGILSDTHLIFALPEFKKSIDHHFRDVDKIVHLGDFTSLSVARYLSDQKELIAVCGNMDPLEIRAEFPGKTVIEISGFKIGLIHGWGWGCKTEGLIRDQFRDVDVIAYGHTHIPVNHRVKEVLFFNPGSPTRPSAGKGTIGILYVEEKITGEIIEI